MVGEIMLNKNEPRGFPTRLISFCISAERCRVTFTGRTSALPAILRAGAKLDNSTQKSKKKEGNFA